MSGSLENLSSNGIVNFDADAYVNSGISRYAGNHDEGYLPFDKPLLATPQYFGVYPGPHLSGHPDVDAFITHGKEPFRPTWKQILAGIGGLTAATIGTIKFVFWHKAREAAKKAKAAKLAKQAKIVKGLKIGGGILLGLGAIYGIYKLLKSRQNKETGEIGESDDKTKKNHFPKLFQPKDKEKVETPETSEGPETTPVPEKSENKEKKHHKPKPIQDVEN